MFYVHDPRFFDLIQAWEFIIAPAYLFLIFISALFIKHKFYKDSPIRKYLIPGLILKLIGAMGVCLIYNYYYKGGDTCNYFRESSTLVDAFFQSPIDGIRLLLSHGGDFSGDLLKYVYYLEFVYVESSYMVLKITAFLQLFAFRSFLITSILYGFISFWAIWKIFKLFCEYYPKLSNQFAIAFLFIPSVFFWGSGILKDTICLSALSLFFCSVDAVFFKKKMLIKNSFIILITGYILLMVKVYIIMSFSVCLMILILLNYRSKIKSKSLKTFITPIFAFVLMIAGTIMLAFMSENSVSNKYSVDKIMETSKVTRDYIAASGGGSTYSLGEIDNSLWGMIKLIPAGVNVTLFRPYLWEAHNAVSLISALESFFILIFTLRVMHRTGIKGFFKTIMDYNMILFCLTFAIIFAYSVGISSFNFGTLVRYKIPCIPFYIIAIQLINYHYQNNYQEKLLQKKQKALVFED